MSGILGQSVWGKDGRAGGPRVSPSLTSAGVPFNPYTSRMRDPNVQAAFGEARAPVVQTGWPWGRRVFPAVLSAPRPAFGSRTPGPGHGCPQRCSGSDGDPQSHSHSQISAASPTSCPLPDNHLFNKTTENAVSETREFYDVLKLCLIG